MRISHVIMNLHLDYKRSRIKIMDVKVTYLLSDPDHLLIAKKYFGEFIPGLPRSDLVQLASFFNLCTLHRASSKMKSATWWFNLKKS